MSQMTTTITNQQQQLFSGIRKLSVSAQTVWVNTLPRTRTSVQMASLLGVIIIAYSYSLTTLLQLADLNTPLAYVSLVPLISLVLAAMHSKPAHPEPAIHDRQTDYIIGLPLMGAALLVDLLLPSKLSAMFWVWRIDLLTLPFFVAGAVAVIFGVRVLWRQKLAVGFLILAWPYPYTTVLLGVLNAFTTATLFGMAHIVKFTHIATVVGNLNAGVFTVVHGGHPFNLSVISACSGVSSVVGFLLVGTAFAAIVRGPWLRKILWLLGGMVLLWVINLGRITLIFWTGQRFGEHFAIDVLHPFIGLVTFSIGVGIMILCIRPIGLHLGIADGKAGQDPAGSAPPADGGGPGSKAKRVTAVPKVYLAVCVVLILGIFVGFSDVGLQSYNLVANVAGESKLVSYVDGPVTPIGWTSRYETTYTWAEPLFGEGSIWNRYILSPATGGDLHANTEVVADVIDSPQLESFSAYGVEQCYQFHGYSLANVSQVALGGGITGQTLAYTSQQYGSWSIVYWIVPVQHGTTTVYERVVLYVQNRSGVVTQATQSEQAGIRTQTGASGQDNSQQRVLMQNQDFLVAFARELIGVQASRGSKALSHRSIA
jgi:exosortase/archaeosortase family protein